MGVELLIWIDLRLNLQSFLFLKKCFILTKFSLINKLKWNFLQECQVHLLHDPSHKWECHHNSKHATLSYSHFDLTGGWIYVTTSYVVGLNLWSTSTRREEEKKAEIIFSSHWEREQKPNSALCHDDLKNCNKRWFFLHLRVMI